MIQQVTRGIKITVGTQYEGNFLKDYLINYAFTYDLKLKIRARVQFSF